MKTSLSHLPEAKQKEIAGILQIIIEEAKPEKVVLFGSHARGNWVEEGYVEYDTRYSYISDCDFLVIVSNSEEKEFTIKSNITDRCSNSRNIVSPIIHDIDYVNSGLRIGQYFFADIIKEGILIYDTGKFEFEKPVVLSPAEEKEKAENYFEIWYPQGNEFLIDAHNCYDRASYKKGIFELHQATESFYAAVLLVTGGYKPKTHNLEFLRSYAKHISIDLYQLFLTPADDNHQKHLFELLKRGYIDARYKKEYKITQEELSELITKVIKMKELVKKICEEKVNPLSQVKNGTNV
jgi:HEPN domain-containing protein